MRVVAGRFGGRRLAAPPGRGTRPTSDRVREALFATLGPLDGERVLDLYAGSGAVAIEALSRGAASALLVERDPRAVAVIRANLDALGLAEPEARIHAGPARSALKNASQRGDTYDLVFLDPPYRSAPELGRELSAALGPLLAAGGRVVTESDRRAPLALDLPLTHERRYGDTLIRIHSHDA
ncbi:MAG TPA: 16S rRNA (guanine(966)-N(2))-methyltransferase RsmD [Solirubrobacteraceae bacterium]|nr:16S rRNA (guanine(966)-N(2))-methyltransferase RsmD [Solirubrobacteraceae bacterium]